MAGLVGVTGRVTGLVVPVPGLVDGFVGLVVPGLVVGFVGRVTGLVVPPGLVVGFVGRVVPGLVVPPGLVGLVVVTGAGRLYSLPL